MLICSLAWEPWRHLCVQGARWLQMLVHWVGSLGGPGWVPLYQETKHYWKPSSKEIKFEIYPFVKLFQMLAAWVGSLGGLVGSHLYQESNKYYLNWNSAWQGGLCRQLSMT